MKTNAPVAPLGVAARMKKFVRNPKGLLIAVFAALLIAATVGASPRLLAPGVFWALAAAMLVDLPLLRLRKKKWVFPDGALLTGLIVAMILSPQAPSYVAALASVVAVVSKHVFRSGPANIFNPAALGLIAAYYVFHSGQSWWGALPELEPAVIEPAVVLILIAVGVMVGDRVKRLPAALAFLGVHYLLFTATAFLGKPETVAAIFRASDLHAAIFCAFFMVTDPPTSPAKPRDQIWFGGVAAAASFAVSQTVGSVIFLLAGLLAANVFEALRRRKVRAVRLAH